jgi:zinc protease
MKFARTWLCIAIALSVILLRSASALADSSLKLPKLDLHETHLNNGLRVILVLDHSGPVYAINVSYNVGSRNELPGHTGFAHLFEHMMFQGSANIGKGEHFILVLNNGGNMNGTTSEDRTVYFEELPKNQLDLGLYVEADRMRSLNVTQANLDNQRNAVEEERRQSIENQPYGRAELDLDSLSYDNFAYKHPTIGSMADLETANIADVAAFFRTYYAPNNAVLTLVGDFDLDEAMAKVKKYFGSIDAQPVPPKVDLREEPHYGERRESISDPLARLPRLDIAYHIPAGNTVENYAVQQLGLALAQGQSSRLYRHLVKEKQLASNVSTFTDARIGTSQMYLSATPRPGVSRHRTEIIREGGIMKDRGLLLIAVAAMTTLSAMAWAQGTQYPITIIPTGRGPYTFPEGYQTPWDKIQIMVTEKISPNLFVLHGSQGLDPAHPDASGGRVMALFGPDGVLLVDTENRQVAEKTLKAIRSFTDAPLKVLVNTHIHSDHTGANALFARQGALIFSQENLRNEMVRPPLPANGQPAPAPDIAGVPVVTYRYNATAQGAPAVTLNMNGETVDFIPMMPSHTAGDTVVRFRKANAIYIEDFYRNFGYPFADQTNGGSIKGMLEAVDLIQKLAGPDTTLIPGHGTLVKKDALLVYRAMLVDIVAKVTTQRDQGKSLKDVLAANLTAPYDKITLGDTQQSKDRFITEVYDEMRDFPPVVDGKRTMPRRH